MKMTSLFAALCLATVLVACPPPTVVVSLNVPSSVTLQASQSLNITATVQNAQNTSVTWSISPTGVGTFTPSNNSASYTAPSTISSNQSLTITARSVQDTSKFASSTINLQAPIPNTTVQVQQTGTVVRSVAVSTQVKFSATVNGAASTAVTWSVVEGATRGIIDTTGNYTAPAAVPNPATATIRATSTTNTSDYGEFQLSIVTSGGISGTVTIPVGLIPSAAQTLQPARAAPQALRERQSAPDWDAPRSTGEVLLLSSSSLGALSSQSATLRGTSAKTEGGFVRVRVPNGMSDQAFAEKLALETGASVQPNYIYHLLDSPNDPLFADQSYLTQIDAAGAWFTQTSVPDNLVAVLDSGINASHPDLAGRVTLGKDFCPTIVGNACQGEDNDPSEIPVANGGIGHGTFATGVIAATTNNNAGVAGITQSGKVLAVKVFGFDAGGATADTVALSKGIKYAADQGAKVISMSLGVCASQASVFDTPDKLTENAITYAAGKGAVLVAAAGNNGVSGGLQCGTDTAVQFPGNNPNVIAVGSVSNANARSSFSATGAALDIMAPGESLTGLKFDTNNFEKKTGTSFAAPQVAAVAALMLAKNPTLTRTEVQSILESTAKDLGAAGKDDQFGAGLLQAGAALSKATNQTAPSVVTTVYMFADPLLSAPNAACPTINANDLNCYVQETANTPNPLAGRALVSINGTSGAVAYSITLMRNGQPLANGTYRVVACVYKKGNNNVCNAGDLGAVKLNVVYNGSNVTGNNLTVAPL